MCPVLQFTQLDSAFIQKEPFGLVLIIAPWNYPMNLPLVSLVGALATGEERVLSPMSAQPGSPSQREPPQIPLCGAPASGTFLGSPPWVGVGILASPHAMPLCSCRELCGVEAIRIK